VCFNDFLEYLLRLKFWLKLHIFIIIINQDLIQFINWYYIFLTDKKYNHFKIFLVFIAFIKNYFFNFIIDINDLLILNTNLLDFYDEKIFVIFHIFLVFKIIEVKLNIKEEYCDQFIVIFFITFKDLKCYLLIMFQKTWFIFKYFKHQYLKYLIFFSLNKLSFHLIDAMSVVKDQSSHIIFHFLFKFVFNFPVIKFFKLYWAFDKQN